MDDSSKLQGLREYRKFLLGDKAALEALRDGYVEIETPSLRRWPAVDAAKFPTRPEEG